MITNGDREGRILYHILTQIMYSFSSLPYNTALLLFFFKLVVAILVAVVGW